MVGILKASPLVTGWQGEELGLHFQHPGSVEPYLHVGATEEEPWPEYLPTWNLHFRVATKDGGSLPLDTQFEGYPGKDDIKLGGRHRLCHGGAGLLYAALPGWNG